MIEQFVIEELVADPEMMRQFERAQRNRHWFNDHALELGVFKLYRGQWVAVSEGELFVGDSAEAVKRRAREKHPDDTAHVQFIPREKIYRIYAHQR